MTAWTSRRATTAWPAARAGITDGDELFALDGQQYFSAEDVHRAVERASGGRLVYELTRLDAAGDPLSVEVPVVRYPAFLYPLNPTIWTISGWGFALFGGYDFWVGDQWAIGVNGRYMYARTERNFDVVNESMTVIDTAHTFGALFSALYH